MSERDSPWSSSDDDSEYEEQVEEGQKAPDEENSTMKPTASPAFPPANTETVSREAVRSSPKTTRFIESISKVDVLLGRGKRNQNWPGNELFRKYVSLQSKEYTALGTIKSTRDDIAKEVIDKVHQSGGRFLQECVHGTGKSSSSASGTTAIQEQKWMLADHSTIRTKTKQALRDLQKKSRDMISTIRRRRRREGALINNGPSSHQNETEVDSSRQLDSSLHHNQSQSAATTTTLFQGFSSLPWPATSNFEWSQKQLPLSNHGLVPALSQLNFPFQSMSSQAGGLGATRGGNQGLFQANLGDQQARGQQDDMRRISDVLSLLGSHQGMVAPPSTSYGDQSTLPGLLNSLNTSQTTNQNALLQSLLTAGGGLTCAPSNNPTNDAFSLLSQYAAAQQRLSQQQQEEAQLRLSQQQQAQQQQLQLLNLLVGMQRQDPQQPPPQPRGENSAAQRLMTLLLAQQEQQQQHQGEHEG